MSKFIFGPLIVLVLIGIAVGAWFFLRGPSPVNQTAPVTQTTTLPVAGSVPVTTTASGNPISSQPMISLPTTVDNLFVSARDFTLDPAVSIDPNDPAVLDLTGTASSSPFSITYRKTDGLFTMLLRAEPLGAVRAEASQKLLDLLQVSKQEACNLIVDVRIASTTNSLYEGKYIGLPFCEWSIPLPQ